jgi:hypothetical protein
VTDCRIDWGEQYGLPSLLVSYRLRTVGMP